MSIVNRELILSSNQNSTDDLALKIFSGMVLEAFQQSTQFYDRSSQIIAVKMIEGATSAQWPILGDDPAPSYHTAGTVINAQATQGTNVARLKTSEAVVNVDEILVNALDVPFRDIEQSHFDVLAPYATKLGRGIAKVLDKKIAILAVKAARTAAVSGLHGGGYKIERDSAGTDTPPVELPGSSGLVTNASGYPLSPRGAYQFRSDVSSLAQAMDEKAVPSENRFLFVTPYIKSVLRFEANFDGTNLTSVPVLPSTFADTHNSNPNDVNNRVIGMLEGFKVVVTNHLPFKDLSGGALTGEDAAVAYDGRVTANGKYQGVFTGATQANGRPVAVALCGADTGSPAIGMVQASGLRSYMETDERRNTMFLKSQMMVGLNVLCPWSAGVIQVY